MAAADEGLTPFGHRVDELRRSAGLSKEGLARRAGMSRQHVWRMSTGRTPLEAPDVARVARALDVTPRELLPDEGGQWEPEPVEPEPRGGEAATAAGDQLEEFVSNMDRIVHLLSTSSEGKIDQQLKVALLNGIEQAARETGNRLPEEFFRIRMRVINGEL